MHEPENCPILILSGTSVTEKVHFCNFFGYMIFTEVEQHAANIMLCFLLSLKNSVSSCLYCLTSYFVVFFCLDILLPQLTNSSVSKLTIKAASRRHRRAESDWECFGIKRRSNYAVSAKDARFEKILFLWCKACSLIACSLLSILSSSLVLD